ncbi:MAG: Crp/Fnr family transcriptional regulator [Planctomycetes bacterium]|nr:Crp/Fnr family transcriptional regulator [Planctomycetota bacterium]
MQSQPSRISPAIAPRLAARWKLLDEEPDACCVVSRRMELLYLNDAARPLVPIPWFGKRCWEVFSVADGRCGSRCPAVRAAASGTEPIYCEETLSPESESPARRGVAVAPIRPAGADGEGAILVLRPKLPGTEQEAFQNELLRRACALRSSSKSNGSGAAVAEAREDRALPGLSLPEARRFLAEETPFRAAPQDVIEALAAVAFQKVVPKGCCLFSMGQPCDTLHVVASGTGVIVLLAPDGRQRVLDRARRGDVVGAAPFFEGREHPATFVAESDCQVLSFPRDQLLRLLGAEPGLCLCLLRSLAGQLRRASCLVEQISFEHVQQRLWNHLYEEARASGGGQYPRVLAAMPTRESIARAIGTVREVVSRGLSRLSKTGNLRIDGRRLTLLRPPPDA